ncbi:MAG: lipopolysaccharide biosynthesis protein [Nitrospinales bacterium]
MTTASLNKRYAAKLSTNFVGLAINLVTYAVIPRGLGPKAYGDFSFLTNFFTNLMPLLSLSTSLGFYTKLSQRQHEFAIVSFYFQFTGLAFTTLMIFVAGSKMVGLADIFWVDQRMIYVYMAALWVMLTWSSQLLTQVADAYGLTVTMETARIGQKCIGLVIILALYFLGHLDLTNFFLYHYGILIILIILLIQISGRKTHLFFENWRLKKKQVLGYIVEFYRYSHPLFVFSLIGLIAAILDRWLLQQFGGSIQQGFFSLSYQIGAVCFLFTSAMTSLLMREFSISYGNNDIKEMAKLFRRYVPLLYSIASYFGCFICVQAAKITYIFGGSKFIEASIPVAIMALYPIHQTYGQLSSSVFFATGQTKVYRNINLFLVPISLVVTYFMLAPVDKMGLNAGATGLAIKFVILQFVGVNIQLFYNARFLRIRYIKYVSHQILW